MTTSKTIKGGTKKSNGHKMDCKCPICKNMNKNKKGGDDEIIEEAVIDTNDGDVEENKEVLKMEGGKHKKKGNGHKADCGCPICKNMRKGKKQGGGEEEIMDETEVEDIAENDEPVEIAGGKHKKKGNGHKADCGCPICKNMRKSKKQGGGEEENIDETEVVSDVKEEQLGGKKRKTRKIKRKTSKRKTKRRKSRRK